MAPNGYVQDCIPEPTSGRCNPMTRKYNGKINCDQVSWIESTLRRTLNAHWSIVNTLHGNACEITKDAIVESAILEIADTLNLEVDRTNIRTRR